MHRLLEWADGAAPLAAARVAAAAREFGLSRGQAAQAALMAQRILQGEGGWAWDAGVLSWQGNEVALHHQGATLRLDRLVQRRDTGAWWVLDYKSTPNPAADAAHVAQLGSYLRAVQALYPQAPVCAAFLTGDGRLVSLVPSPPVTH